MHRLLLHPRHVSADAAKTKESLLEQVRPLLGRYQECFAGTPVYCYEDSLQVCKQGQPSFFINENPWLVVHVQITWLVFCPKKGMRLGPDAVSVTAQEGEKLTLLVLGYFAVSIRMVPEVHQTQAATGAAQQQAPPQSDWTWNGKRWSNNLTNSVIYTGQGLAFWIEGVSQAPDGQAVIQGTLMPPSPPLTIVAGMGKLPKKQYGDHVIEKRLLLDGQSARKRIKKLELAMFKALEALDG